MSNQGYFNPLLASANTLLILMTNVKQITQMEPEAVSELQHQTIEEMARFVKSATTQNCPQNMVLAARYCLCTALDEFVLASDWGIQSTWHYQTLLSIIHKETSGGEKFFVILEEMSKFPNENLFLLELIYIILALGFEGKYYCEDKSILQQIRHRLFNLLSIHHPEQARVLSPNIQMLKVTKNYHSSSWSQLKIIGFGSLTFVSILIIFNFLTFLSIYSPLKKLNGLSEEAQKIPLPAVQVTSQPVVMPPPPTHHLQNKPRSHRIKEQIKE